MLFNLNFKSPSLFLDSVWSHVAWNPPILNWKRAYTYASILDGIYALNKLRFIMNELLS